MRIVRMEVETRIQDKERSQEEETGGGKTKDRTGDNRGGGKTKKGTGDNPAGGRGKT